MPLTDSERSLQARAAAHALHSQRDSKELTASARAGRWAKLLRTVDPDGTLAEPERVRRAESLRKSQLFLAALKSAQVRRAKKAAPLHNGTASKESRRASVADHPAAV